MESIIPTDLFDTILDHADCGTINMLARSCWTFALKVRARSLEFADKHVATEYRNDGTVIRRMPNGTDHSYSQAVDNDMVIAVHNIVFVNDVRVNVSPSGISPAGQGHRPTAPI